MGNCGTSPSTSSNEQQGTSQTVFGPPTEQETAILNQFGVLGTAQQDAILSRIRNQDTMTSPFALGAGDQATLDAAWQPSIDRLNLDNKDYADFLSGGRGLRMSDTPISSQSMQRQALGMSDLLGQKSMAGLNLGLQGNQYRDNAALSLASGMPAGLQMGFNPRFQERMAGGKTFSTGSGTQSGSQTASTMQQILQGAQGFNQVASGVGNLITAIKK